jgi:Tripartite tricarboxylate transporter family receptor
MLQIRNRQAHCESTFFPMPGLHKIIPAVVAVAIAHVGAHAQEKPEDYPTKPVRLMAASPPGGGIDIIARITAQKLSEIWPQQVIVENRPGAGNTLATGLVVKAPPDGYPARFPRDDAAWRHETHAQIVARRKIQSEWIGAGSKWGTVNFR